MFVCFFVFFKQKTAYEMRISDGSSDVGSSDLQFLGVPFLCRLRFIAGFADRRDERRAVRAVRAGLDAHPPFGNVGFDLGRGIDALDRFGDRARAAAACHPGDIETDRHSISKLRLKPRSEEHTSELQSLMRIS